MKLVIAGGGTGGHLFPGIAVAEALKDIEPSAEVLFVGTERGIEVRAVPKAGFALELIEVGGLKRVSLQKRMSTMWKLPKAIAQSRAILKTFGAQAVIGVGGYASGPVLVAARLMGLPTAICEQNSVPGFTNKVLGKLVKRVFLTFESSRSFFPANKSVMVGNPVRRSFRDAAVRASAQAEGAAFQRGLVFTFGGSQGARPLNEAAPKALALLATTHAVTALHQAGKDDVASVEAGYKDAGVAAEVTPFIDDMVAAYRRAHVVICRAGATSCAEILALGVPAILVPFPQAADDHQTKNARDVERAGACVVLEQKDMTPETLAAAIGKVLADDAHRTALCAAARAAGRLDAGERIARAAIAGFAEQGAQGGLA
jgi:UDP-N-acetylglucosamine--N-acetylmuramyl-(pentapeptide) pyrophosphoryl-undecaprenol N-acetylglucosamine transferase